MNYKSPDEVKRDHASGRCENLTCSVLSGSAGSGKSYEINRRCEEDSRWMGEKTIITATTGVAAVNLPTAVTLHSLLKVFDSESIADSYIKGYLAARIYKLQCAGMRNLVVDEISMMGAQDWDTIFLAVLDCVYRTSRPFPLHISVVGDFAQLAPVKAKWAFKARCWEHFMQDVTWLDSNHRQGGLFAEALQTARLGDAGEAVKRLKEAGVVFASRLDQKFQGTTIMATNAEADRFNQLCFSQLSGAITTYRNERHGRTPPEWKLIPEQIGICKDALIMTLVNNFKSGYVNGDLGTVMECRPDGLVVKIHRTGLGALVPFSEREFTDKTEEDLSKASGGIHWLPVRLAYASTCHKSQGLTLDAVQVDCTHRFFASPGLAYVAISRARSAQKLRLIGTHEILANRLRMDKDAVEFAARLMALGQRDTSMQELPPKKGGESEDGLWREQNGPMAS